MAPRSTSLRVATVITATWIAAWFATGAGPRPGTLTQRCLTDVGLFLLAIDLIGFAHSLWAGGDRTRAADRVAATESPEVIENPAEIERNVTTETGWFAPVHPSTGRIDPAQRAPISIGSTTPDERQAIARAAMALLVSQRETEATIVPPVVHLIRVGIAGIELLLAKPCLEALSGFSVMGDGLVWRLDDPAALEAHLRDHHHDDVPDLTVLGDDDESTFFMLSDLDDPPYCDERPPRDAESLRAASGTRLAVVETADAIILEPYGLRFRLHDWGDTGTHDHETPQELKYGEAYVTDPVEGTSDDQAKGEPSADRCGEGVIVMDDGLGEPHDDLVSNDTAIEPEVAEIDATSVAAETTSNDLVPRGRIEVRILRDQPDIVGELCTDPTPAAIEFVAYLALHGHRSTTSRLRDAIGTQKIQTSRSGKTVWSAASAARKAVGSDLLPGAAGNELYRLSPEVTGDWLRFRALVDIAKAPGTPRERCRVALTQALELVGGVPASESRRFMWLDEEGILEEITRSVTTAATMLTLLELEERSSHIARSALDKGLMLSPGDRRLLELEQQLTHTENLADAQI